MQEYFVESAIFFSWIVLWFWNEEKEEEQNWEPHETEMA